MSFQDIRPSGVQLLYLRKNLMVFDTRDANNYAQGHLQGAIPPSDEIIKKIIIRKQRNNPVLVYCYHGNSSKDFCSLLCGFGFTEVYNLEGGWLAWQIYMGATLNPPLDQETNEQPELISISQIPR